MSAFLSWLKLVKQERSPNDSKFQIQHPLQKQKQTKKTIKGKTNKQTSKT